MHHCFEGGWIWVIPFDNETCSVGAVLDRSKFPLVSREETQDEGIEPIEELRRLFARYPTVESHLGAAEPLFAPIRTDRIQFSSKTILSDGVILTPHAAGFVDPLFSSGFLLTAAFLLRFVPLACDFLEKGLSARQTVDFFAPLDECYQSELDQVDRLGFRNPCSVPFTAALSPVLASLGGFDLSPVRWPGCRQRGLVRARIAALRCWQPGVARGLHRGAATRPGRSRREHYYARTEATLRQNSTS